MAKRFKVASGTVAIWDDATDTLPFSDPYTYLSRVKFHSSFDYVGLDSSTPTISTSVSVAAGPDDYTTLHTLGTHGKSGTPFVFGSIQVSSTWQPWVGAVPIWNSLRTTSTSGNPGYSRLVTLSLLVDGTYVYAFEQRSSDTSTVFPAVSVPVKVWVSSETF